MWSSYDERYGWTESSSRRPETYHSTTATYDVSENVDPIKTWTSLDIAKPEWEKRDEKTDIKQIRSFSIIWCSNEEVTINQKIKTSKYILLMK